MITNDSIMSCIIRFIQKNVPQKTGRFFFPKFSDQTESSAVSSRISLFFSRTGFTQPLINSVTFAIEPIKGKFKVIFMFLPGCDFDFDSFRFNK